MFMSVRCCLPCDGPYDGNAVVDDVGRNGNGDHGDDNRQHGFLHHVHDGGAGCSTSRQ